MQVVPDERCPEFTEEVARDDFRDEDELISHGRSPGDDEDARQGASPINSTQYINLWFNLPPLAEESDVCSSIPDEEREVASMRSSIAYSPTTSLMEVRDRVPHSDEKVFFDSSPSLEANESVHSMVKLIDVLTQLTHDHLNTEPEPQSLSPLCSLVSLLPSFTELWSDLTGKRKDPGPPTDIIHIDLSKAPKKRTKSKTSPGKSPHTQGIVQQVPASELPSNVACTEVDASQTTTDDVAQQVIHDSENTNNTSHPPLVSSLQEGNFGDHTRAPADVDQDEVIKPSPTSPINRKIPKVNTGMTEDLRHQKIRYTGQSMDSMSEELMSITSKDAQDSRMYCWEDVPASASTKELLQSSCYLDWMTGYPHNEGTGHWAWDWCFLLARDLPMPSCIPIKCLDFEQCLLQRREHCAICQKLPSIPSSEESAAEATNEIRLIRTQFHAFIGMNGM
eukprot:scaffold36596_cov55-Attheya_sp.AAC.1